MIHDVLGLIWLLQGADVLGRVGDERILSVGDRGPIVLVVGLVLIAIGVVRTCRAR